MNGICGAVVMCVLSSCPVGEQVVLVQCPGLVPNPRPHQLFGESRRRLPETRGEAAAGGEFEIRDQV